MYIYASCSEASSPPPPSSLTSPQTHLLAAPKLKGHNIYLELQGLCWLTEERWGGWGGGAFCIHYQLCGAPTLQHSQGNGSKTGMKWKSQVETETLSPRRGSRVHLRIARRGGGASHWISRFTIQWNKCALSLERRLWKSRSDGEQSRAANGNANILGTNCCYDVTLDLRVLCEAQSAQSGTAAAEQLVKKHQLMSCKHKTIFSHCEKRDLIKSGVWKYFVCTRCYIFKISQDVRGHQ